LRYHLFKVYCRRRNHFRKIRHFSTPQSVNQSNIQNKATIGGNTNAVSAQLDAETMFRQLEQSHRHTTYVTNRRVIDS
jgi:hypothetical protein